MLYNRLIFLFLLIFSAALIGCSQEETANPRTEAYVLTATQDERNAMKYQFKVTYLGRELTSKDASFLWNFGDAAGSSTEAAPVYEYVEEGERKVTVLVNMNSNAAGISERISQDAIILVGKPTSVYNSIITARPGTGVDLLNYTLTSSAVASEEVGGENGLNYQWVITGPDGENGTTITTTYPDQGEILTGNTQTHRFKKFGYAYDVSVYIKPAEQASFDMTKPSSTMYLTTALPPLSIQCISIGKDATKGDGVECSPVFDYDIKYGMNYEWTFYSIDGTSIIKDGDLTTTGDAKAVFYYPNSGAKMITVRGTHPTDMIGTVEATANITLSSAGILNQVTCFRPVDNLGNYTDATKLQWRCEAQGYYNRRENLNKPLPLTSYTWAIKENGASIPGAEFSWGSAGDVAGGDDKIYPSNSNVRTRVDCDDAKNICTASLIYTADKYGANYLISLSATQQDQDDTGKTHSLSADNVTINVDMPKITGITRTTSATNPMQSIFTPTYDTTIPDNITLNHTWNITGDPLNNSGDIAPDTVNSTNRTLTYVFPKSGVYTILLSIASNKFSDGTTSGTATMPPATTNADRLSFELNQNIAGSYFNASVNALTGQIRFFTDYEARVDGKPVDTTYVYTITGPTYTNPRENTTNKVVLNNKKEFETIVPKPDSVVGTVSNNVRLIFNGRYTVTLDVYNSAIYNNGNPTGGVDGATQKQITINPSTPTISYSVFNTDAFNKGWNTQIYAILDSTLNGTSYGIDRSLFNCRWQIKQTNSASPYLTMALNEPIDPSIVVQDVTYPCDNRILINAKGVPDGTTIGNQTATLTVTGPAYNTSGGGNQTHTQDVLMRY